MAHSKKAGNTKWEMDSTEGRWIAMGGWMNLEARLCIQNLKIVFIFMGPIEFLISKGFAGSNAFFCQTAPLQAALEPAEAS